MGIIDLITGILGVPFFLGGLAGVVLGLGIAFLVHLLFPFRDLASLQALIVAVCCLLGLVGGGVVASRSHTE